MFDRIKGWFSKKMSVTVATAVFLWINNQLPIPLDPDTVRNIVTVVIAYLAGQSLVDVTKAAKTK